MRTNCPKCQSTSILVDAVIDPNTEEVYSYDTGGDNQGSCRSCGEVFDPWDGDNGARAETTVQSMRRQLARFVEYILEEHYEEFKTAHGNDGQIEGPDPDTCSYCEAVREALTTLDGEESYIQWEAETRADYARD